MYTTTEKIMVIITAAIGLLFLIQGIRLLTRASVNAMEKYHDFNTHR